MTVYIVAPAHAATGGPELLHQLAKKLIDRQVDVKMYYLPKEAENPVHSNYIEYLIPYETTIEDDQKNILIVPEIYTKLLENFKQVRKMIWWLSVDNYFFTLPSFKGEFNLRILNYLRSQKYLFFNKSLKNEHIVHLYQSEYARVFLKKYGITNTMPLSDYIHQSFIIKSEQLYNVKKKDIVVYNPKKGSKFTNELIRISKNISFVPIENMSRSDVVNLLASSKVYIDFGFHPGKDRIPREAVLLGNCILTGKKGSANNPIDIPINEGYKFIDHTENLYQIKKTLQFVLRNYETEKLNFQSYRNRVLEQELVFDEEVDNFILKYLN